jgi:hypothetical protein
MPLELISSGRRLPFTGIVLAFNFDYHTLIRDTGFRYDYDFVHEFLGLDCAAFVIAEYSLRYIFGFVYPEPQAITAISLSIFAYYANFYSIPCFLNCKESA